MSTQRVLFDLPGPRARRRHLIISVIGAVAILALLGWLGLVLWERNQITPERWAPLGESSAWVNYLLPGLRATAIAAAFAIVIAFVLGLLLVMGRMSDLRPLRWATAVFIEFFRAVPVLIMMLFVFFLLSYNTALPPSRVPLIAVIVGLVCYNAAVIAEVIRNGVASLPAGQREAGLSIGLSSSQVRRLILVPQALTAMLPTLVSQLVVVLKDTALGYIILYPELLNSVRQMGSRFGNMFVAFVVGAVLFIIINWMITKSAELLEGRLRKTGRVTPGAVAALDAGGLESAVIDTAGVGASRQP